MSRLLKTALVILLFVSFTPFNKVSASLYINEVMPNPSDVGRWLEIYSSVPDPILDNYVVTSANDASSACAILTNNNYVHRVDNEFSGKYKLVDDLSVSFNTDLVLYLIDCNSLDIVSTLFVPLMEENHSFARYYDGSTDAADRDYSVDYLNTKGKSNNVVPIIENLKLSSTEYTEGELPKIDFDLIASEADFDEVRLYLNGYMVERVDEYKDSYSIEIDNEGYFFSGVNNIKVEARSSVGSSQEIVSFDYITDTSTITYKTIHNSDFFGSTKVAGVVSSNNLLDKVTLKYKEASSKEFKEYRSIDLVSQDIYRYNYEFSFEPTTPGDYVILIEVKDTAFTNSKEYSEVLTYDPNAPKVSLNIDPDNPDGKDDYYVSKVKIEIKSSEKDADILYKWNDAKAFTKYDGDLEALEGKNTLYYKTVDKIGNESSTSNKVIKVDTIDPDVYITLNPELPDGLNGYYIEEPEVIFNSFFDDIEKYEYSFDKVNWETYREPYILKGDSGVFFYRAVDKAGNRSETKLFNLKTAVDKPSVIRSIDYELTRNNALVISWSDYKSDETYLYEIYKSTEPNIKVEKKSFYTAVPSTDSSYVDTKLVPSETYYYLLVKKNNAGSISDPVRFEVTVPGSAVLGIKNKKSSLVYLLEGPVVKSEKSFVVSPQGDVLGVGDSARWFNLTMFFISLSIFVFILMGYVYKLRTQNAS